MKILIIGTTASSVIGFRKGLVSHLSEQGHEVYAFATDYTASTKEQVAKIGAVPVEYSLSRTGVNPFVDLLDMYLLSRAIRSINPDVVFSYFAKPVIFGTIAAKLAGVQKCVAMLEGLGHTFTEQPCTLPFKTRLVRWIQVLLYRISFPLLNRLIFLNPDDPKDLIDKYKIKWVKRVDVLGPIGLDLVDYPYSSPKGYPLRFVFVGRLLAEKGINDYLMASKLVKSSYPDVEFLILGGLDSGNPGSLTHDDLDVLVRNGEVIYPGHVTNVAEWIASSSVFVLPSYYREGVPRSTQEAMAIGRAVITTDVPGCRETVVNGVNGFLVPKWSPEELANAMLEFIKRPELVAEMGRESRRIAQERFDSRVVNSYLTELLVG